MPLTHEDHYYTGFRNGDEKAFEYVYAQYYRPLYRHGYEIIDDEFTVNCIVNEAFLKGWKFRESMENMRHIYCFIRQDVSWKCFAYVKNPSNRFHRLLVRPEYLGNLSGTEDDEEAHQLADKNLKAIEEALPYLPGNRQTIMTLYFKYGYSYKRIARRFGTTNQAISLEVQRSLESLRKMVHAQKKLHTKAPAKVPQSKRVGVENMETEMQMIFRLRYEQKHSFASIAEKMQVAQGYVQQQYIIAHRRLRALHHP